ncbi:MAG: NAD(P)H-dependent oxidoreductase subunit E, partial [Deltaproteobacteria bacterium]|nr:NAD(P)H-dependent oxidoreductase subunit E [Deltaproteobacteria bacterium]
MFPGKSREEIEQALKKYPTRKSAVMDLLRIAQKERGHINKEDMDEIAKLLDVNPIVVNSAATFYTMYQVDKAMGRHHIWVCRNISCSL